MTTFADWIFSEQQEMERTVLTTFSGELTLTDLKNKMKKYLNLLGNEGNLKGKKIAVLVPQIPEYFGLLLAINQLGGIFVPLSHQLRRDDLTDLLEFIDPHMVWTIKKFNDFDFEEIILNWTEKSGKETSISLSEDGQNWSDVRRIEGSLRSLEAGNMDIIGYSSGSTGTPKGMMLDTEFIIKNSESIISTLDLEPSDCVYHNVSPNAPYGLFWFFAGFKVNFHTITTETFDVPRIVSLIDAYKPNKISTSPSLFRTIFTFAKAMNSLNCFRNLKVCSIGGEMIQEDLIEMISPELDATLISTYGTSELGFLMYTPNDLRTGIEWLTVDDVQYKVVNDELLLKIPKPFIGYYKRPDLMEGFMDEQGWFCTGDMAFIQSNNRISLQGRKKNVIKKGGQTIFPEEIEFVLSQHIHVKQAVVVGIPHPIMGEKIVAFIVGDGDASPHEIRAYCSKKIAAYKVPDQMKFIDKIPTNNGKIDRLTLRQSIDNGD